MDFSDLFKYNGQCAFSPDSKYVGNIFGTKVCVRDLESLEVIQLLTNLENVASFAWSANSSLIACAIPKKSCVQVWSLTDNQYRLQINEIGGVQSCFFSPDGNFIFITTDLNLKITIWTIEGDFIGFIKNPKYHNKGYDFAATGNLLAIAERKNGRDYIHIMETESYDDLTCFEVETEDLADLKFSPCGKYLLVWDSPLDYKLCLYRLDGSLVNSFSPYENLLGIKKVGWAPSNNLLAIGSYDSKVRIVNRINWKVVQEFDHMNFRQNMIVYRETFGKYEIINSFVPKVEKIDYDLPNPKVGVGLMDWSANGKFLVTREDSTPNCLWVWDCKSLNPHSVLIHNGEIKSAKWSPIEDRLAISSGNGHINFWSPDGCAIVEVPESKFNISTVKWSLDGKSLLLGDGFNFCCSFLVQ